MTMTPGPDCQEPMVNPYAEHDGRVAKHYAHAREKHPYFADVILDISDTPERTTRNLLIARDHVDLFAGLDCLRSFDVHDCEIAEAMDALAHGDNDAAVEELYDAIAVLLRTIDVLEGRQALGKPEKGAR